MPHTIGCFDGNHIGVECTKLGGTLYYSYKGVMAIWDANYCATLVDSGQYSSNNDCDILANSDMGRSLTMIFWMCQPTASYLNEQVLPYFSLGDEIFPSKKLLMRFYPEKKQVRKSAFATTDTQDLGDALKMLWYFKCILEDLT